MRILIFMLVMQMVACSEIGGKDYSFETGSAEPDTGESKDSQGKDAEQNRYGDFAELDEVEFDHDDVANDNSTSPEKPENLPGFLLRGTEFESEVDENENLFTISAKPGAVYSEDGDHVELNQAMITSTRICLPTRGAH